MTEATEETKEKLGHQASFVQHVFDLRDKNKGMIARLKRANNPATEYQCWELLAKFNVNLEHDWKRLPYATIAAAIAHSKNETDGQIGIGKALYLSYMDEKRTSSKQLEDNSPAKVKLRRLLACDSTEEVCRILRPILSLVESRGSIPLNFDLLLKQLTRFHANQQGVKAEWAQDFYAFHEKQKEESKKPNKTQKEESA